MKRKLVWILVIILLGGAAYLVFFMLSPYKKMELFQAIPAKPVFIVEMDNSYETWKKLVHSDAWKYVRKHPFFERITSGMDYLESFENNNEKLAKILGRRSFVISMHEVSHNEYDFLYAADLRRVSKLLPVKDALGGLLEGKFKLHVYHFQGVQIYQVRDEYEQGAFYITLVHNLLISSGNQKLVEASIAQMGNPVLANDVHFLDMHNKLGSSGILRIYINYAMLEHYTNGMLSTPDPNISELGKSLYYTGLALGIDKNNIICMDGYTNLNDSVPSSFRAMMHSGTGRSSLQDILPANTATTVSLGFNRFTDYFDNMIDNRKDVQSTYATYQKSLEQITSYLKIDLRKNILGWISDEVVMVYFQPVELGPNNDFAVFLKARDMKDAQRNLDFVAERVRKRTPVKIDQIDYEGYSIKYISMKGFFKLFLGKYFQRLEKPYFTYIGDYVVFSNHPQLLKNIIDGVKKNELLANLKGYNDFIGNFSKTSNVFLFLQTSQFIKSLQSSVNASTWSDLEQNQDYIKHFPMLAFQLEQDGAMFRTRLYIQCKGEEPKVEEVVSNDTTDNETDATSAPDSADNNTTNARKLLDQVDSYIPKDVQSDKFILKFENGNPKVEMELKDGFRHGKFEEYYENGKLKIKGNFKSDQKDGTWKVFNDSGKILAKFKFEHGKLKD